MPTARVAAGSLVVGYAVARASHVRPPSGVVLAGTAWCARGWAGCHRMAAAAALGGVQAAALAVTHRLGAWPSPVARAVASFVCVTAIAERRR